VRGRFSLTTSHRYDREEKWADNHSKMRGSTLGFGRKGKDRHACHTPALSGEWKYATLTLKNWECPIK